MIQYQRSSTLFKEAKKVIPGGTMLFSKNPDLFLPAKWPAYFSKSKGCKIWDLNGNCFKDLAFMGVGTNTLGYAHPNIEKKVFQYKIMTKKRFSLAVENLVADKPDVSYIDAAVMIIEERGMQYQNLKKLLTDSFSMSRSQ